MSPGLRCALYVLQRNKPRAGSRSAGFDPVAAAGLWCDFGQASHVLNEDLGRLMAEDPLNSDAQSPGREAGLHVC